MTDITEDIIDVVEDETLGPSIETSGDVISEFEDENEFDEQEFGVISEQEPTLSHEQEPVVVDEQEHVLGDEQEHILHEEQEPGLSHEQETVLGNEQELDLERKQEIGLDDKFAIGDKRNVQEHLETSSDLKLPDRIPDKVLGDDFEIIDDEEDDETQVGIVDIAALDMEVEETPQEVRTSINYDVRGRLGDEVRASRQISGDFTKITGDVLVLRKLFDFQEEEEEEKVFSKTQIIKVAVPVGISDVRKFCLNRYKKLAEDNIEAKLRHSILQRIIAMYYRKKNMNYCLRHLEDTADMFKYYYKKLDDLELFLQLSKHQQECVEAENLNIIKIKAKREAELDKLLNEYQTVESQIGHGLIYAKTGATLSDKLIDRYLYRQRNSLLSLRLLRLHYLQVKSKVSAKEDEIYNLDRVDSKYTLLYYSKLKAENRAHSDKIEEKETELARVRKSSQDTIEILSHVREKLSAVSNDIYDVKQQISLLEFHINSVRIDVNKIKQERDMTRFATVKLKTESGLLHHPDLLRDMETSKVQYNKLKKQLEIEQFECRTKVRQLRNARKTLEGFIEMRGEKIKVRKSNTLRKRPHFQKKLSKKPVTVQKNLKLLEDMKVTATKI